MGNLDWNKVWLALVILLSAQVNAQKKATIIERKEGLSKAAVNDIAFDNNDNIWIATNDYIYRIPGGDGQLEKYYDTGAYCLGNNSDGEVFAGLKNNQLFYPENYKTFPLNIENNDLINCLISHKENFVAGTKEFIINIPERNVKEYTTPEAVTKLAYKAMNLHNINQIVVDSIHRLWIASDSGLYMMKNQELTLIKDVAVSAMIQKPNGLWLATEEGIYTLDRYRKWKKWEVCPNLSDYKIEDMELDSRGNLWMVSNVLTVIKNNGECEVFDEHNGFKSKHGLSISIDRTNNVWIGTEGRGVFLIKDTITKPLMPGDAQRYAFMSGYKPNRLIFLLDLSSSMNAVDRLPLLKSTIIKYVGLMRPEDEIAIISFGNNAEVLMPFTSCAQSADIINKLDDMQAGGLSKLDLGLQRSYEMLLADLSAKHNNRILIATDGKIEVNKDINKLLRIHKSKPISISTFDFGTRSNTDLKKLSQSGKGDYYFIKELKIELDELLEQQVKPN